MSDQAALCMVQDLKSLEVIDKGMRALTISDPLTLIRQPVTEVYY